MNCFIIILKYNCNTGILYINYCFQLFVKIQFWNKKKKKDKDGFQDFEFQHKIDKIDKQLHLQVKLKYRTSKQSTSSSSYCTVNN